MQDKVEVISILLFIILATNKLRDLWIVSSFYTEKNLLWQKNKPGIRAGESLLIASP